MKMKMICTLIVGPLVLTLVMCSSLCASTFVFRDAVLVLARKSIFMRRSISKLASFTGNLFFFYWQTIVFSYYELSQNYPAPAGPNDFDRSADTNQIRETNSQM